MTTVFYASTLFGAMCLATAIDTGEFAEGRRVLVVSNNAAVPEVTPSLSELPAFAAIASRFDEVHSWNEIISPLHPSAWKPRSIEAPMLERLLADRLSLDGPPAELVLESIPVAPARTLAGLIRDCPITVYAEGLMGYGPTRDPLPREISGRITRLLHLDLVPGVTPLLLSEYGVRPRILPHQGLLRIVADIAERHRPEPADAIITGQYLSALEVLTPEEEHGLHAAMLRGLAARGARRILFKPHPTAGRAHFRALQPIAERLHVRLSLADGGLPAEAYFTQDMSIAGCFSTALFTARNLFGLRVATHGAELLLERLKPYENGNRIPVTLADALLPRLGADGSLSAPAEPAITDLVKAVGYCMRHEALPGLRPAATRYLRDHGPDRYFKRRRLEALDLPRSRFRLTR